MSFSLEARIRYEGMVAGHKGEGYIVVVRSLRGMRRLLVYLKGGFIHPRVYHAWCLNQDYLLEELDAAYSHTRGGCIHSSQDIRFDRSHKLPMLRIVWVGYTGARSNMRESSHRYSQRCGMKGSFKDADCTHDTGKSI